MPARGFRGEAGATVRLMPSGYISGAAALNNVHSVSVMGRDECEIQRHSDINARAGRERGRDRNKHEALKGGWRSRVTSLFVYAGKSS